MIAILIDAPDAVLDEFARQRFFGAEIIVERARVPLIRRLDDVADGDGAEAALGEQDLGGCLELLASAVAALSFGGSRKAANPANTSSDSSPTTACG